MFGRREKNQIFWPHLENREPRRSGHLPLRSSGSGVFNKHTKNPVYYEASVKKEKKRYRETYGNTPPFIHCFVLKRKKVE